MVEDTWSLVGISFLLLLIRFLAAAGVVRLLIEGTGLGWGLGLAVALAICMAPLGAEQCVLTRSTWSVGMAQELLLGLCLGAGVALLLAGIQFVSNFAFMASPWGLEPSQSPAGPLRKLFLLIAVAGFLHMQGDRIALQQLVQSLKEFPPGQHHVDGSMGESLVTLLSACFRTSLTLAAPLIAAVLFTHLLLGFLGRSLSPAWFPALHGVSVPLMLLVLSVGLIAWTSWLPNQLPSFWQDELISAAAKGIP